MKAYSLLIVSQSFKKIELSKHYHLALLINLLMCSSCVVSIPGKGIESNTSHHLVIGFGIVSVNEPDDIALVSTSTQVLGVNVSDRPGMKLGIGYSANTVITVPNNAEDVRVEVSQLPGKPFIVDIQSAIMKSTQSLINK